MGTQQQICVQDVFEYVLFGSILGESIIDLVIIGLPFEFKASQKATEVNKPLLAP